MNIWGETQGGRYRNALAINGRSWPWTERLKAVVGDTVRWRIVNASNRNHPMHLHGAYFRVDAKGDAHVDTVYPSAARRLVVTELMTGQQTMDMAWSPLRRGRWLFHCHFAFHATPADATLDAAPPNEHASHELATHMSGLVLGITAELKPGAHDPVRGKARTLDLYVQEGARRGRSPRAMSFVLRRGALPTADSVLIPGSPLILTRGEPTDVVVRNRLREPVAVHWHGLELESYSDGVAGWSGVGASRAPVIVPGGRFTARLSMPRAGTFLYHTHMKDVEQLTSGLYGPIVVLEPGKTFDARTDHLHVVGWDGGEENLHLLINGDSLVSPPIEMRVGEAHRLRFAFIGPAGGARFTITRDSTVAEWRARAKDGADLPRSQATVQPARLLIVAGETYDFEFKPGRRGEYVLSTAVDAAGARWTRRLVVR